jgi:hypothetical protein
MARVLVVMAWLACLTWPANAQQRIFAIAALPETTDLWEARVDQGQVVAPRLAARVPGAAVERPILVGGGQYVLWRVVPPGSSNQSLAFFDRANGAAGLLPGVGAGLVSDPTRARVFAGSDDGVRVLTAAGTATLPNTQGLTPAAISHDGATLYATSVANAGSPPEFQVHRLDTATGAVMDTTAAGAGVSQVAPGDTGASAWILSMPLPSEPPGVASLRHVELPSGVERLFIPLEGSGVIENVAHRIVGTDIDRRRVVVSTTRRPSGVSGFFPGTIRVFDAETGTELPQVSHRGEYAGLVDRGTGLVLSFSQGMSSRGPVVCGPAVLQVQSTDTADLLSAREIGTSECLKVAIAAPPVPPTELAATISSDRTVSLTWTRPPEMTTRFTVEAGSGTGLADLAVLSVGSDTAVSVPNVPPRVYYVRVRAWNYIGASEPSNEIVVTVP